EDALSDGPDLVRVAHAHEHVAVGENEQAPWPVEAASHDGYANLVLVGFEDRRQRRQWIDASALPPGGNLGGRSPVLRTTGRCRDDEGRSEDAGESEPTFRIHQVLLPLRSWIEPAPDVYYCGGWGKHTMIADFQTWS